MWRKLRAFLVVAFSLTAMSYAILESGIAVYPVQASWSKGCCNSTQDCSGNMICYTSEYPSGWGTCGNMPTWPYETAYYYCNTAESPDWSNDGIEIEQ